MILPRETRADCITGWKVTPVTSPTTRASITFLLIFSCTSSTLVAFKGFEALLIWQLLQEKKRKKRLAFLVNKYKQKMVEEQWIKGREREIVFENRFGLQGGMNDGFGYCDFCLSWKMIMVTPKKSYRSKLPKRASKPLYARRSCLLGTHMR